MSNIRAIRSETDYEAALARIDELMDAESSTHEGEELDVLTDLVERYEAKTCPHRLPEPAWSKGGFHELAHIGRHMIGTSNEAFVDHLSLRDVQGVRRDPRE